MIFERISGFEFDTKEFEREIAEIITSVEFRAALKKIISKKFNDSDDINPETISQGLYIKIRESQRIFMGLRVLEKKDRFPYLLKLAEHYLIDEIRKKNALKRGAWAEQVVGKDIKKPEIPQFIQNMIIDIERHLKQENGDSPSDVQIFKLWKLNGFTTRVIAEELGTSTATVNRAKSRIRNFIQVHYSKAIADKL